MCTQPCTDPNIHGARASGMCRQGHRCRWGLFGNPWSATGSAPGPPTLSVEYRRAFIFPSGIRRQIAQLEPSLDHHPHHPRHPGHHRDEPRQDQLRREPVRSGVRDRSELLRSDLRSGLHGRSARPVRRSLKTGLRHPPRRGERRALSARLQVPLRTSQNPVGLRGHPERLYGALVTAQLVRHRPRTSSCGPWRSPAQARAPHGPRAWPRRRERRRAREP